jgi:hypothetical protein
MVLMEASRIFENLSKLILVMMPKYKLSLMICSPITQIHKNIGGQEEIVSKIEKQLEVTRFFQTWKIFRDSLTLSPLWNSISPSI